METSIPPLTPDNFELYLGDRKASRDEKVEYLKVLRAANRRTRRIIREAELEWKRRSASRS